MEDAFNGPPRHRSTPVREGRVRCNLQTPGLHRRRHCCSALTSFFHHTSAACRLLVGLATIVHACHWRKRQDRRIGMTLKWSSRSPFQASSDKSQNHFPIVTLTRFCKISRRSHISKGCTRCPVSRAGVGTARASRYRMPLVLLVHMHQERNLKQGIKDLFQTSFIDLPPELHQPHH
jgi:hypothetical protein